jgi:hypothetical protein
LYFYYLLNILNVFSCVYVECRNLLSSSETDPQEFYYPISELVDDKEVFQRFDRQVDFKLSQTYDNVVAIAIQCISNGNSPVSITEYYADVQFTFKQMNGTTSGTFQSIYTSKHLSIATWMTDDNKGIELSSISILSYWNSIHCNFVNITTGKISMITFCILQNAFCKNLSLQIGNLSFTQSKSFTLKQ